MKRLAARCAIALVERAARWRPVTRVRLAHLLGDLLWCLARSRRHIALVNLRLCFPQMSESERRALARRNFRNVARAAIDHGLLATLSRADFDRWVRIDGAGILSASRAGPRHGPSPTGVGELGSGPSFLESDETHQPLILVAPHFVGLDAGGLAVSTLARPVAIYARSRSPEWDRWLLAIRNRFNEPLLIQREGFDLRAVVRALKDGLPFYYLPDQDPGSRNGIFVPFFGVTAATLPMVPRLAKLAGARVALCVTEMTDDGYVLHIEPPLADYPSGDVAADTARMNAEIERWVRRLPDQYLWTHRRFKTRPAGEGGVY